MLGQNARGAGPLGQHSGNGSDAMGKKDVIYQMIEGKDMNGKLTTLSEIIPYMLAQAIGILYYWYVMPHIIRLLIENNHRSNINYIHTSHAMCQYSNCVLYIYIFKEVVCETWSRLYFKYKQY